MTTNVLLINRQLVFAVTIKQALEQTGLFAVHPFTSADAALDYLRGHPHEVALVDFTLPDYNGPQLVRRLRAVQPDIAVIVSPAQPNARVLMQELDLQGVVDAPFSARTIIPVIEHAVELIEQPLSARTRSLIEGAAPDASDTDVLDGQGHDLANTLPPGDAERFGGAAPHTRVFDADSAFDDEGAEAGFLPPERAPGTRLFTDDPDMDAGAPPGGATRLLDDDDSDDEAPPWERPAPGAQERASIDFSSLGSILLDEAPDEYEPPTGAEDTPAVPTVDSDAVRQFLATRSGGEDDTFGSVLDAINQEAVQQSGGAPRITDSFDDLVNSMRSEREHTPLPDRHQQFVEFILTGGMDNLLNELEKAKTGPLTEDEGDEGQPAPPDSFAALAAEEPPLPTLEESGTIGDLMIGVSDTSFRNVLALMRGEQVAAADSAGFEGDFEGFFGPGAPRPDASQLPEEDAVQEIDDFFAEMGAREPAPPSPPPPRRDRDDTGGIPARMILETAQDESTPADSFSLDTLIDDIERQLEQHSPDIKPLPSWGDAVKLPRRPAAPPPAAPERFVKEPDFLPETFAEPEQPRAVAPLPTWEDAPDETFETTMASRVQREQIEAERDFQETEALAGAPEAEPEAEFEFEPEPEFEFDSGFEFEFESESEFEPEAPPQPEQEEPDWPAAEMDIAAAWESFVPASAYADDEAPAGAWADEDEALPAFAEGPFYSDEPLTGERAPVSAPDEAAPDWMEGLALPLAEPAFADDQAAPAGAEPDREAAAPDNAWALAAVEAAPYSEADDPYIAQLALSLTQVSLELTAEATLLTRDGEVAASAGALAPEDIGALRAAINDRWEPGKDEARINFVALDGGVREYMLYSRQTAGGFTLTMVFGGATPLRDIRRQGKRLLESLAAVPDTPLPPAPPPPAPAVAAAPVSAAAAEPAQAGPLAPYTYMWLLRDPEIALNETAAQAITAGLRAQLNEQGWQVRSLEAQGEYVYVYADVPGERAAYVVVDELKRRTADILHAQFAAFDLRTLWAESYLVMAPGRELDADEIAQFIDFERLL